MNRNTVKSQTDENLRLSRRRGAFASAAMLCGVVILFVIGACVLSLGLHSRGFAVRTSFYISVRCLAYAGLTKAFFEMNEKLKVVLWDDSGLPEVTNEIYSIAPENQLLKCLKEYKCLTENIRDNAVFESQIVYNTLISKGL